jgi:two-component system sensor histidine kinase UhpB
MQDNGQGCRLPSKLSLLAQEQHFGLIGLQEMVEAVQGELQVESAPGKGYRLSARLPLK